METDHEESKFYKDVLASLNGAGAFTKHPKGLIEQIIVPNSVYEMSFPSGSSMRDNYSDEIIIRYFSDYQDSFRQ